MQRIMSTAVGWALLWVAFWTIVVSIISFVDPDSIDPGEGPLFMLKILGPMGLFTGAFFGFLFSIGDRNRPDGDPPFTRVVRSGILATAIVQVPYLGHGDQGLTANIQMALLFCVVGGVVTVAWLGARKWWKSEDQRHRPVRRATR